MSQDTKKKKNKTIFTKIGDKQNVGESLSSHNLPSQYALESVGSRTCNQSFYFV